MNILETSINRLKNFIPLNSVQQQTNECEEWKRARVDAEDTQVFHSTKYYTCNEAKKKLMTPNVFYFNQSFKWYLRVKYQFSLKRPFWLRLAFWGCREVLIKIICRWEFHLRRRWQLVAESTDSVAHVSPLSWWDETSRESWTLAQKSTLEGFT